MKRIFDVSDGYGLDSVMIGKVIPNLFYVEVVVDNCNNIIQIDTERLTQLRDGINQLLESKL